MYFPTPYRDELTGSLVIRASRHLGLTPRSMAAMLTGKQKLARDFPFLIPFALPLLSRSSCIDVGRLLWEHTVFPYACITFDKSRALATESRLTSSASANLQFRLENIFPQHVAITPYRRFCETCCENELRELGESYWHVSHALPAVAVCPRHKRVLRLCSVRLLEKSTTANILPEEADGESASLDGDHEVFVAIARESVLALHSDLKLHESSRSCYRTIGASLGYDLIGKTHLQETDKLTCDLETYFGAALLRDIGLSMRPGPPIGWPLSLMCGRSSLPQAQLKHVLMRVFFKNRLASNLQANIRGLASVENRNHL